MQDIVIVAAARTAVGKFGGSLASISAPELGAVVVKGISPQPVAGAPAAREATLRMATGVASRSVRPLAPAATAHDGAVHRDEVRERAPDEDRSEARTRPLAKVDAEVEAELPPWLDAPPPDDLAAYEDVAPSPHERSGPKALDRPAARDDAIRVAAPASITASPAAAPAPAEPVRTELGSRWAAPPPAEIRNDIKSGMFDAAVFTSATAVRNMIGIAGKPHSATVVAAIGPATASACEMHGLRVDVVASAPTFESLAESLADFADKRRAAQVTAGLPNLRPSQRKRRRRRTPPAG